MPNTYIADEFASANIGRRRPRIVYVEVGQSLERGQTDPSETIKGVSSFTAYPQAYRSLRRPGVAAPIHPAGAKFGSKHFKIIDDLWDWGYEVDVVNCAIGSAGFANDIVGTVYDRSAAGTNSYKFRAKRAPAGPGDRGFTGDYLVASGKLFVCTTGNYAYCMSSGGAPVAGDTGFVPDADYTRVVGSLTSAASSPDFSGAAVGGTIADGGIVWTCVSASTTYLGYAYTAGGAMTEARVGFDPYGMLRRAHEEASRIRDADYKVVSLKNMTGDSGSSSGAYSIYLQQAAYFFLSRGYYVAIGLSMYAPVTIGTAAANNLKAGVAAALGAVKGNAGTAFTVSQVMTGADLYTLLGSGGSAGGASINASISGTTLTVNSVAAGTVEVGQLVTGTGVTPTLITAGSGTSWTVDVSQTVASVAMLCGGSYFAKDAQDVLHPNAPGHIEMGRQEALVLKALVPQLTVPSA